MALPHDASRLLYTKGRVLMQSGQLEAAVQAFEQSVAILPHFKTLELLGECLLELGRPVAAIVPLAAASHLNKQVRAPALLARALLEIKDFALAFEIAEEVISRAPGDRIALKVLANPSVVSAQASR